MSSQAPDTTSPIPRYKMERRGNRLHPTRLNSRYEVLSRLAECMRRFAGHDALAGGELIIDFGCGDRPYEEFFRPHFARYVGVDLPGNPSADADLTPTGDMPFEAGVADCVLSSQVLEHVQDPMGYLREAHRVLRPDGNLILSTHGVWQYHPDPTDYWRWTGEGLRRAIESEGFVVTEMASVLGKLSTALQLLQDATAGRMRGGLGSGLAVLFQLLIGLIEALPRADSFSNDASVYVVLARRAESPTAT
jgi:SAM-dependent methyltransferase